MKISLPASYSSHTTTSPFQHSYQSLWEFSWHILCDSITQSVWHGHHAASFMLLVLHWGRRWRLPHALSCCWWLPWENWNESKGTASTVPKGWNPRCRTVLCHIMRCTDDLSILFRVQPHHLGINTFMCLFLCVLFLIFLILDVFREQLLDTRHWITLVIYSEQKTSVLLPSGLVETHR